MNELDLGQVTGDLDEVAMERIHTAVATLAYTPDDVRAMAREIELLRRHVRQLQHELSQARASVLATEATELGRTLLIYVLDVLCALFHPQRGQTVVADAATATVRTDTNDTQSVVGPLQMALERPSLIRAIEGKATCLVTRYESVLWLPIVHGSEVAVIICLRRGPGEPFSAREKGIGEVLGPLVISALQTGKRSFDLNTDQEALLLLSATLGSAIRASGGRVAAMERDADRLGQSFNLNPDARSDLRLSTILHDIGTVDLADDLVQKEGTLSATEVAQMREHTAFGAEIIRQLPGMEALVPLVFHHHERWDGRGYPTGLSGSDIPLGARIIAVVDAFHAMITPRSYRAARSVEDALGELEGCAGTQFDPQVVQAFMQLVREG